MGPAVTKRNFSAWDIDVLPKEASPEELLKNMAGFAILAPSSHNIQPWRFVVKPKENLLEICLPKECVLPASDKKGRQAHVSVGCALENLILAGKFYGFEPVWRFLGAGFCPQPLVSVKIEKGNAGSGEGVDRFIRAMKERRVNRSKFAVDRPVPEDFGRQAFAIASGSDLVLDFISDTATKFAIAEIQYAADRAVINLDHFRKELSQYLLPNDTESFFGMPGNTFGLSDESAFSLHEKLKGGGVFDPDLALGMAISSRDGIRSAPVVGVLSTKEDEPFGWIKAGAVFEGIALLAQTQGLGVALHAAIVEVELFSRALKLRLGRKERPVVIFRVGYPTEERPHSPRLPLEEVCRVVE